MGKIDFGFLVFYSTRFLMAIFSPRLNYSANRSRDGLLEG